MKIRYFPFFLSLFAALPGLASATLQNGSFQQRADHEIHVRLDDRNHFLHARIQTRYVNNSPDTLRQIYIHLWPNAYSSRETAFARQMLDLGQTGFHYASEEEMGYIDSLAFRVQGLPVKWELEKGSPDIGILWLNEPLLPGHSIEISTPFRVKIPSARFSRLGHEGQAYYITQWYPKPAVYDLHGWHPMPYLNYGEFYSDFGNVDVFLTLPENYVVASTGKVMTPEEDRWLQGLSDYIVKSGGEMSPPSSLRFPPSSVNEKTIHLRQENVHDFAWFADKRFRVLIKPMNLPGKEEPVKVSAFFYADSNAWEKVPSYTSAILAYMSEAVSPYPWDEMSVVQGLNSAGAGMEYPAVTLIGDALNDRSLERVVIHETIHNWFYGTLATNERRDPWLDEGLTTYYENRYMSMKYPGLKLLGNFSETSLAAFFDLQDLTQLDYIQLAYLFRARANKDQPMDLHTRDFSVLNYFIMTYYKSALSFMHLEDYLGRAVFDSAMKDFGRAWNFRHPGPADLMESFERVSNKDLSWFFEGLAGTDLKTDYSIEKLEAADEYISRVEIANRGDLSVPFSIAGIKNGQVIYTQWQEGFEGTRTFLFPRGDYDLVQINPGGIMPEINRRNNNFWFEKRFPRQNPAELQLLGSIENPEVTRLYYLPVVGFNKYDGFMAGVALYNYVFPYRRTELFAMPLYGTGNDRLAGTAWLYHSFFPKAGMVHSYRAGVQARRYGFTPGKDGWSFNRLQASLTAVLDKPHAGIAPDRQVYIKSTLISRNFTIYPGEEPEALKKSYLLNEVGFTWDHPRTLNPYSFALNLEQGEAFLKLSGQARYFFHYPEMHKGVSLRFFGGVFLKSPGINSLVDYRFRMGGYSGIHDYSYENIYLGRTEPSGSFLGNQITEQDGGFKYPTPVGQSWDWLMAVNLKADLPAFPLKAYLDAGTYAGASTAFNGSRTISWVLGVQFVPVKNFLEINFPIAVSPDLRQVADFAFDNYFQQVTFSLYLDRANPFRYLRNPEKALRAMF